MEGLRTWLIDRGEKSVYFFKYEIFQGEKAEFQISVFQLTWDTLWELQPLENIIVGKDFSWTLYIHHEGILHVAGPKDLFSLLKDCTERWREEYEDEEESQEWMEEILFCPACKSKVKMTPDEKGLKCVSCNRVYPIRDNVPVMLIEEAIIEGPEEGDTH